jgi:hypothetical protein
MGILTPILLLLTLSTNSFAQTAAENFKFAYVNLEHFVNLCLADRKCDLNSEEAVLVQKISKALATEKANKNQLQFASERERPGLFIINGNPKAAKTFDTVGSIIYVNKDMITQNGNPMGTGDALAILVHEMGHHHGELREDYLDIVGFKVSQFYHANYYQSAYHPRSMNFMVSGYNYWKKISVNMLFRSHLDFDIVLSDELTHENLTGQLSSFKCEVPATVVCDTPTKKVASSLQNIYWTTDTNLQGQVVFICECYANSLRNLFSVPKTFELNLSLISKNNKLLYRPKSAQIRITP